MAAPTNLYSGPGKLFFNGVAYQPDGENGQVSLTAEEKTTTRGTAMFGEVLETLDDQLVHLSITPWDSWSLLGALFPKYLGVTTAAATVGTITNGQGTGALVIGTRPHDLIGGGVNQMAPAQVWTEDGRLYTINRGAFIKHPGMKFGPGVAMYEQAELIGIGDPTKLPGADAFMLGSTVAAPITESGESGGAGTTDPDTTGFSLSDFVNGVWIGAWGAISGFTNIQAEDYWQLVPSIKYSPLTVQKVTRHYKLDSARFMLKCRPTGPTHTNLLAKIFARTTGQILKEASATDLVLTGPSSKTVTLKNCELKGAGFEFGGTRLGTGEIGFVTTLTFTTGAPQPSLIFSS